MRAVQPLSSFEFGRLIDEVESESFRLGSDSFPGALLCIYHEV